MQISTELNGMFSYSFLPIFILGVILIDIILINKFRKNEIKETIISEPNKIDKSLIKERYLKEIAQLIDNINSNKISNRRAYQKLSSIIRNFIFEMTNVKVQNYTLSDINKERMPILYELVSEYYDPEFSVNSGGIIIESIEKTKRVIEKWN